MIKNFAKKNLKTILKFSVLNLIYSFFIIPTFIISQNIKKIFIKKIKYHSQYVSINIVGNSDNWILGRIKKEILANRFLSNKEGYKVNFFLHYSLLPNKPNSWFSKYPNILFFTHEDIRNYRPYYLYRKLFSYYELIVCMNNESNKYISRIITNGKHSHSEKVVTNYFAGLSTELKLHAEAYKKSNFKKDNIIKLGFHCRPYSRKRPELVSLIIESLPNFKLICCGEGHSQLPIYDKLKSLNRIEFKEYIYSDLHLFYKEIDLLICSSSFEGGPTPLMEANAFGIPFLSTNVGFAKEISTEYDKVVDVDSSISTISKSLTELTKNIYLKPKTILTWEEVVDKFYLQIKRVLKE
nr:glycosyltransferase [Prochlorococcus marinus]